MVGKPDSLGFTMKTATPQPSTKPGTLPLSMTRRTQTNIADWLVAGRKCLREGKLQAAESYFDRILTLAQHPEALHLKGAAALQQGRVGEAVPLLEAAVRAEQRNVDYLCDLGTAYHAKGDLVGSEATYRLALDVDSVHVDATYNLANLLRERGQF